MTDRELHAILERLAVLETQLKERYNTNQQAIEQLGLRLDRIEAHLSNLPAVNGHDRLMRTGTAGLGGGGIVAIIGALGKMLGWW